jgi:hypothetical protein
MDRESPEIPLTSHAFTSVEEAIRFLQRARRRVLSVTVLLRVADLRELPPEDPALAAVIAEQRALQGDLAQPEREAEQLQEPPAAA